MIAAMERPTQTRIARELVAEQSTISRNLQLLKAKGLIKTTAARSSPYQTISLTPKGVERVREAIPIWERTQNAFVKKFGESRWVESLDSLSNAISSVHAITLSTD
jgi:DNA-binding MarR family transcriptional regulator